MFLQELAQWCIEAFVYNFRPRMPVRHIAAKCGNTHKDNVSLFKFPSSERDSQWYNEWERQVKRTRDKWSGPTRNSRLFSRHFTEDQFDPIPKLKMSLGMNVHCPRLLKSTAVPINVQKRKHQLPEKQKNRLYRNYIENELLHLYHRTNQHT